MGGVALRCFQHRAQLQVAAAVLGDGQALAAGAAAIFLVVAGVVEAEFAADFQPAARIYPVLVVGLVGHQGAAPELPVNQIFRGKAPPLFIGVVLFKLVPLKVNIVAAAVPHQAVGIIEKAGGGLQMEPLTACFCHGPSFLLSGCFCCLCFYLTRKPAFFTWQ